MASTIKLNVNGTDYSVAVASADMPLLWVLRDVIGLTGTKYGCGIEVCGACTVLINNKPERSCDVDVSSAVGKRIVTVEGLASDPDGKKAQAAWIDKQVPQCGYCQSGMLMSAVGAMKAFSSSLIRANRTLYVKTQPLAERWDGPHDYTKAMRERMYWWMDWWLKGKRESKPGPDQSFWPRSFSSYWLPRAPARPISSPLRTSS